NHLAELVQTSLAQYPLRRRQCAQGKPAAAAGGVGDSQGVVGAVKSDRVGTGHPAGAGAGDGPRVMTGCAHLFSQMAGGAGGRVALLTMVGLPDEAFVGGG